MKCSPELLEGYLDQELEPGLQAEVEEHLAGCAECSAAYDRLRAMQSRIRSQAPRYEAPPGLQKLVRQAVERAAAEERSPRRELPWRMLAIAASLLLAVSLGWNFNQLRLRAPERETIAQNVIASHVRSLIGTHLLDVTSTDQHTVKPWFNGRLDFAPMVKDLAPQGFPLIGGRIEYLSDRAVAALIYQRRKHVINLFTWPVSRSDAGESHFSQNGYNVLQWSDASMTYWAVSDVSASELNEFRELLAK